MERLWTPWRRAFVEGAPATDCFLCIPPSDAGDRVDLVLSRAVRVFVILNRYPYNNGHLMIAPYAHTGDFDGLETETAHELMRETQRSVGILRREYRPDGLNIGMNLGKSAGAGIPDHLHVHVVPRWNGDTNFMPVLSETKVLPESLEQTYERLEPLFRS